MAIKTAEHIGPPGFPEPVSPPGLKGSGDLRARHFKSKSEETPLVPARYLYILMNRQLVHLYFSFGKKVDR